MEADKLKRKNDSEVEAEKTKKKKLWGGRFSQDTNELMAKFNASIQFDKRMYSVDLTASQVSFFFILCIYLFNFQ